MSRTALLALVIAACGGSTPAPAGASGGASGQDLVHATSLLCAAPVRAEADLEYHTDDATAKTAVLDKHMKDQITNARVLATINGWTSKSTDQKVGELDQLTHDALLSSKCRLREVWAAPATPAPADPTP